MRKRCAALLLAGLMILLMCAPTAFAASATPDVVYQLDGNNSAQLSIRGLSANIYAVQLEFSVTGGKNLTFEPELSGSAFRLDTSETGSVILYLDSKVPLNSVSDNSSSDSVAVLGVLKSDSKITLGSKAKLTTLNVSLVPTVYETVSVGDGKNSGGNHGGGGGGGSSASTPSDQTISAGSNGKATLSKSALASAETVTVSSGNAKVTFSERAVKALRNLNADVEITAAARKVSGESRLVQAQLTGTSALYDLTVTSGGKAVSLPEDSVTMSLPFTGKGKAVAYLLNEKGSLSLIGEATVKGGTATFSANPTAESQVVLMDVVHRFKDVSGWYEFYVNTMVNAKVMSGVSDSSFQPDKAMTRAELVTTLANLSGDKLPAAGSPFADVAATDWFAPYVAWAQQSGITAGVTPERFMPQQQITREQMAVMLVKFMEYEKKELTLDQAEVHFADDSQISGYAREAIYLMQRSGVIGGKTGNRVDPQGQATRAECAKMLATIYLDLNR